MSKGSKYRDALQQLLTGIGSTQSGVVNPDRKVPDGVLLGDIFTWQYISDQADAKLKAAWKAAQGNDGNIEKDDELRDLAVGDHVVAESPSFSCVVTIGEPKLNFDKEEFIRIVAKTYKLSEAELTTLASTCKKETAKSVSKKVLVV